MSSIRMFIEFCRSISPVTPIEESTEKTVVTKMKDKLPEFPEDEGSHLSVPVDPNVGGWKRLSDIEGRQDRVRTAGEKRMEDLDLIRQVNRDVRN